MRTILAMSCAAVLATAAVVATAAQSPEIDAHVAAARAAIGADHQVLFTSLCSAEPTGPGTRAGGAGQPQRVCRARSVPRSRAT